MISAYANTPWTYEFNYGLDGSQAWTANASIVALDFDEIYDGSNTDVSPISATMNQSNSNLPNPNNFSVTLSANSHQMATYITGGVDPQERIVVIQTVFMSNTGSKVRADNLYLRVYNSTL